ncbi:TRAP transporter, DctM subunit [Paucidesulfovibrio gracilis DSM 16080]|uniref:TRAP transporter, DctM subunit n=1 Tax=Paucidesulfovibrio gracilis DSM 16080 TaxID=1121449 RepID=A0A1T4X2Y9_9BACT|nr:TRAP transporter large permease [Paucidesulfovibrio gracilis]SKA83787.1 TRAP transporter, DctM subunit [Paucidesulfovibrio gracilis DSM 16080]
MDPTSIGLAGVGLLLAVIFLFRIPVGFAMGILGLGGYALILNTNAARAMLGTVVWDTFSSYGLTVIPLFIFMGQICFYSGVNERLYKTAYVWMGQIRGGMAMATVLACGGFAAICGSNTATAATMSSVALPEMKKYGYSPVLSTGAVAAGSTLGVVIPPSVVLIIYGLQVGESIGKLFWGGMLPGLLLILLFLGTVRMLCLRHADWGPAGPRTTLGEKIRSLPGSLEMLLLFGLVMGGLFAGFFSPTEVGAAGSALALLLATVTGKMTWKKLILALSDTIRISCMILVIMMGAVIFAKFLTIARLPSEMASMVASLAVPSWTVILLICLIYAVGGMVMDALALLLVTIPIFQPVVQAMGYDMIWFGVLITVVTTMGAITPPVGVNTFIVASMAGNIPMRHVFAGVSYFLACYALVVALLMALPQLALWLPSMM